MVNKTEIFKLVWRGWFIGATALLVPAFLIVALVNDLPGEFFLVPLLVPLISAMQGVLVGGLVVLGLTIWPAKS